MSEGKRAKTVLDVRNEFDVVLNNKETKFHAAFSFNKSYPDAPNPALKLSDLGIVGLPLSTRDAEAIKSRSVQAPFGMGERTLVDKNVRDTWEMDAKLVSFANPKWDTYVSQTVVEVCKTLGVNIKASKPRAELYKLLLYETGSHFLPHVDTEKANGMFATIVIVLPSHFTGGAAHLSFGELSAVYDCSGTSQLDTTVLAWYTDVTHEIKPITSGYRLALSYNLVHTTQALRPALAANSGLMSQLTRLFTIWRDIASGPEKLLYLLDHKYSEAGLRASALKGADAQKVALLDTVARRHGFRLGLANAHCRLSGYADDDGGRYHRNRRWYGDSDSDSDDDADVDFAEVEDRDMTIEHFVDLEGELIAKKLEYDEEGETIPVDLAESVESGPCDGQEYEGYMGNGAGSLERWYRRTVLVIWPARNNNVVLRGTDPAFNRIVDELSSSDASDEGARELADWVLTNCASGPAAAGQAVGVYALEADDSALWTRIITACAPTVGVKVIEPEVWMEALERWGWDTLRPSFELILESESGNAPRLAFLKTLQSKPWEPLVSDVDKIQALQEEIRPWAQEQVQRVLQALKKPTVHDCPVLIEAACENGGIVFLNDVLLPQLVSSASEDVLREFATQLFASDSFIDCPEKSAAISVLLSVAIASATFFTPPPPPPPVHSHSWYMSQSRSQPTAPTPVVDHAALAKRYVQTCVVLGCSDLIGAVLDKVGDTTALQASQAQECARSVMLPLAAACVERMCDKPESIPREKLDTLRDKAAGLYIEWLAANKGGVTRADVAGLIEAVTVDGNAAKFFVTIVPRLEAMGLSDTSIRAIIDELHDRKAHFAFPEGYAGRTPEDTIASFVQKYVATSTPYNAASLTPILDWLFAFGVPAFWQSAVMHYSSPPRVSTQVGQTAVWLVPALRQWGIAHGVLEQLGPAFQQLMKTWLRHVLGPKPNTGKDVSAQLKELNKWTCLCAHCKSAKTFLTRSTQNTTELQRIGAPRVRHVEGLLSLYARGIATYYVVRTSPQGLRITKSDAVHKPQVWKAQQAAGVALLKHISSDAAELKRILATEYDTILSALGMVPKTTTQAGASASTSTHPTMPAPSGSSAPATPAPGVSRAGNRAAPAVAPLPPSQAHHPALASSSTQQPAQLASNPAYGQLATLPRGYQLPAHIAAALPSQGGAGPSAATAALLQQVQLPPNAVNALLRSQDSRTANIGAPIVPDVASTTAGSGASDERPAKKRKMLPVNPDDIIDLT